MNFQNPSINSFLLNGQTDARTDKPKAICSLLFQVRGITIYVYTCKPEFCYIKIGCNGGINRTDMLA